MLYAVLIAAIVFLVVEWIKWRLLVNALVYFMIEKDYTPPSEEEMEAYLKKSLRNHIKDIFIKK
ncbi:MAG: hypothetical protein RR343_02800 [Oscillospiraceae bacterium]